MDYIYYYIPFTIYDKKKFHFKIKLQKKKDLLRMHILQNFVMFVICLFLPFMTKKIHFEMKLKIKYFFIYSLH